MVRGGRRKGSGRPRGAKDGPGKRGTDATGVALAVDALAKATGCTVRDVAEAVVKAAGGNPSGPAGLARVTGLQEQVSRRRKDWSAESVGMHAGFVEVHRSADDRLPPVPWCGGCSDAPIWRTHWHCQACGHPVEDAQPARSAFATGDLYTPIQYEPRFAGWRCGGCLRHRKPMTAQIPPLATALQLLGEALRWIVIAIVAARDAATDPDFAKWLERQLVVPGSPPKPSPGSQS